MKSPLTIVKAVSTPTLSSWAQAYNAGNIAAVISLEQKPITQGQGADEFEQELSLAALGKEILSTLEAEYFTLETKTLQSIRQAIETTVEKIPQAISVSLVTTVLINNVLYLYVYGPGRILMKRQGKLGILLDQTQENKLTSCSGFIEHGDIVILETASFTSLVPNDLLVPALETGDLHDFVDALSPALHNHGRGDAAALAFSYHDSQQETTPPDETAKTAKQEEQQGDVPYETGEPEQQEQEPQISDFLEDTSEHADGSPQTIEQENFAPVLPPERQKRMEFSHKRKLLLSIAVVVLIVLAASMYVAISKQKQSQVENAYTSAISPAQEKYTEGEGLLSVNQNLARQDFQQAHDMLAGVETKFPAGSKEQQGIEDLQKKINDALSSIAVVNQTNTKQVDTSTS